MSLNKNLSTQTALVTGANAGLGFETAAQLAEMGYGRIILATRTLAKGTGAKQRLIERTSKDVFDLLAVDVAEVQVSARAAQNLIDQPGQIDLLILNAGLGSQELKRTTEGFELTLAASLVGHHVLTMKLLEAGKLAPEAHIVISGSEGARGEMSGMEKYDYNEIQRAVGGGLDAAMNTVARGEKPAPYNWSETYANAKTWVAWWTAVLARKLPEGMVAVTVSPGSNPDTSFVRNVPTSFRIMMKVLKIFGPLMKMGGPVADGAKRYIDAGSFGPETSGKFYASPQGKMVGPMEVQPHPHFYDERLQEAAWNALVRLSGIGFPESVAVA
ncbi:MAG: SDR family NAD(P)-dependent oxidoreductase [Chloroflexi bacterium]|nr:MAG: SDR family NAD(P)-dependent oxidoreductase [Chloroflexota bacterium]